MMQLHHFELYLAFLFGYLQQSCFTAHDTNGRSFAACIGHPFGLSDVFLEVTIELLLTTRATNALCSLLMTVRGSSEDALMTPSVGIDAYVIVIGLV